MKNVSISRETLNMLNYLIINIFIDLKKLKKQCWVTLSDFFCSRYNGNRTHFDRGSS